MFSLSVKETRVRLYYAWLHLAFMITMSSVASMRLSAQTVNVEFQPLGGVSANYAGQGAFADPGNNFWNSIAVPNDGTINYPDFGTGGFYTNPFVSGTLKTSSGATTPYTVTLNGSGSPVGAFAARFTSSLIGNIATNALNLMKDYLITFGTTSTVTINNLPSGSVWTLYLYGAGDRLRSTAFSINGGSTQVAAGIPGGSHTLTQGRDYVVFQNVAAQKGTLVIRYTPYLSGEGDFNGFQLVDKTVSLTALDLTDKPIMETPPSILSYSAVGLDPKQHEDKVIVKMKVTGLPSTAFKAYVEPIEPSGGHEHVGTPTRPRPHGWLKLAQTTNFPPYQLGKNNPNYAAGSLEYSDFATGLPLKTDKNGQAIFYYYAPELSGMEMINISIVNPDKSQGATTSTALTLRFPDLTPLPTNPSLFNPIGQTIDPGVNDGQDAHPARYNGTASKIQALTALAKNYQAETGKPLPVNDMSLPDGGLFDIGYTYGPFWSPPHIGHRRGDEADIGNAKTGLLPGDTVFETLLREQGWWIISPTFWKSEVSHYHLNLSSLAWQNAGHPKDTYNGMVTIKPVNGVAPLPANPSATWVDTSHTEMEVTLNLINRGGLDATDVTLTGISFVGSSPSKTLTLITVLPLDYGGMRIRATMAKTFRVLVSPAKPVLSSFKLRVSGTATSANGSFPFASGPAGTDSFTDFTVSVK